MKAKILALLCAGTICVVVAGTAVAATPAPKFDARFGCAKVAPASLMTSLASGFGGTYSLKPHHDKVLTGSQSGGFSACEYWETGGWPSNATTEGPGEVVVEYGKSATAFYKANHTGAVQGSALCAKSGRSCPMVPITGLGGQAYEYNNYVAVLRGHVFLRVWLNPIPNADQTGNVAPPDGLVESIARALLARLPAM